MLSVDTIHPLSAHDLKQFLYSIDNLHERPVRHAQSSTDDVEELSDVIRIVIGKPLARARLQVLFRMDHKPAIRGRLNPF